MINELDSFILSNIGLQRNKFTLLCYLLSYQHIKNSISSINFHRLYFKLTSKVQKGLKQ